MSIRDISVYETTRQLGTKTILRKKHFRVDAVIEHA